MVCSCVSSSPDMLAVCPRTQSNFFPRRVSVSHRMDHAALSIGPPDIRRQPTTTRSRLLPKIDSACKIVPIRLCALMRKRLSNVVNNYKYLQRKCKGLSPIAAILMCVFLKYVQLSFTITLHHTQTAIKQNRKYVEATFTGTHIFDWPQIARECVSGAFTCLHVWFFGLHGATRLL